MPTQYRYLLHTNGPALWPEHKPAEEIEALKASTVEGVWEATYQGNPSPPGGSVFKRAWWRGKNRYDATDQGLINRCVGRWISWDTGLKDKADTDFSAYTVGELLPDYILVIRQVEQERLEFPDLPSQMESVARQFNRDEKLRGLLIEDKVSGTSSFQTLQATAPEWLRVLLIAFNPTVDKVTRASQGAVWCRNDCVLLPWPSDAVPWLVDFEDQLFTFPGAVNDDMVDSLSQLLLYLENLLADGWRARRGM
jgi:predicted phage terminase large subunit-like protein